MSWTDVVLANATSATVLAVVVALVRTRIKNPALLHVLWGLVLLKLIAPPAIGWSILPRAPHLAVERGSTAAVLDPFAEVDALGPAYLPRTSRSLDPRAPATDESVAREARTSTVPAPIDRAASRALRERVAAASPAPRQLFLVLALGGSAWVLVGAIVRAQRLERHLRASHPAPASLQARVDALASEMGCGRAPRVRLVDARISPAVWSWVGRRAEILVPSELLPKLSDAQRDALLAHELAHVHRRDHWLRPFELAAVALWWWHPVAWWARRNFRQAEERACDACVLRLQPGASRAYADALLAAAEFLARSSSAQRAPLLATGASNLGLKERIVMIFAKRSAAPISRRAKLALALAAIPLLLVAPIRPGGADAAVRGDHPVAMPVPPPTPEFTPAPMVEPVPIAVSPAPVAPRVGSPAPIAVSPAPIAVRPGSPAPIAEAPISPIAPIAVAVPPTTPAPGAPVPGWPGFPEVPGFDASTPMALPPPPPGFAPGFDAFFFDQERALEASMRALEQQRQDLELRRQSAGLEHQEEALREQEEELRSLGKRDEAARVRAELESRRAELDRLRGDHEQRAAAMAKRAALEDELHQLEQKQWWLQHDHSRTAERSLRGMQRQMEELSVQLRQLQVEELRTQLHRMEEDLATRENANREGTDSDTD